MRDVGLPRSRRAVLKRQQETFNHVRALGLDLLEGRTAPRSPIPLTAFFSQRPLVDSDDQRC